MSPKVENPAAEFVEAPSWSGLYSRLKRIQMNKVSDIDSRSTTLPNNDWDDWRFAPEEIDSTMHEALEQVDTAPDANSQKKTRRLKAFSAGWYSVLSVMAGGLAFPVLGGTITSIKLAERYGHNGPGTEVGLEGLALITGGVAATSAATYKSIKYADKKSEQLEEELQKGHYGEFIDLNEHGRESEFSFRKPIQTYQNLIDSESSTLDEIFVDSSKIRDSEKDKDSEETELQDLIEKDDLQAYCMKFMGESRYREESALFGFEEIQEQVKVLEENSKEIDVWMQLEEGNPFYTIGVQGTYEESVEGESEDYEAVMMGLNPEYEIEGWDVEHFLPDNIESPYLEEFEGNYRDIRTPEDSITFNEFETEEDTRGFEV